MDNESSNDRDDSSVYTLIAYTLGYGLPATFLGSLLMRAPVPFNGIGLAVLVIGMVILLVRLVGRYTRGDLSPPPAVHHLAAKEENRSGPTGGDSQDRPHPPEPDPTSAVPSFAARPPAEPLLASPVPPPAPAEPAPEIAGDEVTLHYGDRRWRVRGLARVSSFEALRVNVLVSRPDPRHGQVFHVTPWTSTRRGPARCS